MKEWAQRYHIYRSSWIHSKFGRFLCSLRTKWREMPQCSCCEVMPCLGNRIGHSFCYIYLYKFKYTIGISWRHWTPIFENSKANNDRQFLVANLHCRYIERRVEPCDECHKPEVMPKYRTIYRLPVSAVIEMYPTDLASSPLLPRGWNKY